MPTGTEANHLFFDGPCLNVEYDAAHRVTNIGVIDLLNPEFLKSHGGTDGVAAMLGQRRDKAEPLGPPAQTSPENRADANGPQASVWSFTIDGHAGKLRICCKSTKPEEDIIGEIDLSWDIQAEQKSSAKAPETVPATAKYTGPTPTKTDALYFDLSGILITVEKGEAVTKDQSLYTIEGSTSTTKVPGGAPRFMLLSEKILPKRLDLYKVSTREGHREIRIDPRNPPKSIPMTVTRFDDNIYSLQPAEPLEPGEYTVTPKDSNIVFCFTVT
jgi:hypothetical protein